MNPKFWGPHAWIFLHSITMNYPKESSKKDKDIYKNFFLNLQSIIPCEKCAYNYKRHLEDYPIDDALHSREALIQWLINIHNEVNKELNKPLYTYDQVIEEYKYKMFNINKDYHFIYKLIILALLCIIIYLLCKKK